MSSRTAHVPLMVESPVEDSKAPADAAALLEQAADAEKQLRNAAGIASLAAATAALAGASPAEAAGVLTSATPFFASLQQLCAKASFGGLMASTGIYWWRAAGFGGGVEGKDHGPVGSAVMTFSSLALALLLIGRWIESGHFPLSNMYESLLFLGWGVTAVHVYIARSSPGSAVIGALTSPLALCVTAGATLLLPKDLQQSTALVPALKSNWLMMHVSVMMMSYAALLASSLIAGGFLVLAADKDGFVGKTRDSVSSAFAVLRPKEEPAASTEVATDTASETQPEAQANPALAAETIAWSDIQTGSAPSATLVSQALEKERGATETTNDLAYQCGILGWNFLTIGLISGAVWANEAWGSYWSWDPKETWALVTWLVYSVYLHTRISPKYDDQLSNSVCFFGFIVTWTCYAGVNLMGLGTGSLHSYTR
jgi:cytochrome c-type biogenesis protein CcsB